MEHTIHRGNGVPGMSPIWRNAGGDILLAGSVPALVRAWSYRKKLSDCGPLPAWIVIIGCDPPDCVEYKDTNLSPTGRMYLRQTCGAWSGSGGYAWPSDVPNCPYPAGVTITAAEGCGGLIQLTATVEGELCSVYFNFDPNSHMSKCTVCAPFGYNYSEVLEYPQVAPSGALLRSTGGWSLAGGVVVGCDGSVTISLTFDAGPCVVFGSGSGSIPLNSEGLPIGSTIVPVYSDGILVGTLSVEFSVV